MPNSTEQCQCSGCIRQSNTERQTWQVSPQTTRENWRYIYRLERQGISYQDQLHRMRDNARISRESFRLAQSERKSLLERLADFKDKPYCHSCDEIVEYVCSNCDNCETDCCECPLCSHCEERVESVCSECDQCENHCDCNTCNGCSSRYRVNNEYVYFCSSCDRCGDCCECYYCESCDSRGREYCGDCDRCDSCCDCNGLVKQYITDPLDHLSFLGNPKDKTWYGIELEVNYRRDQNDAAERIMRHLDGYAILKHDGSLEEGFEIVTAPATIEEHRKHLAGFFADNPAKYLSSWESGQCGIHVHISRPRPIVIGKMICFLNASDNAGFIKTIAGRGSNHYSELEAGKKVTDAVKYSDNRYEALNLTNEHTVELRIFRGTLKESSFWKCIEFTHALVHFCRDSSVSDNSVESFLRFITLPRNRRQYRNLIAFLVAKEVLPTSYALKTDQRGTQLTLPVIVNPVETQPEV